MKVHRNSKKREKQVKKEKTKIHLNKNTLIMLLISVILIIVAASFVLNSAQYSTTQTFDDDQYFFNNQLVKNPSWNSVNIFLSEITRPSTVMGYYQPVNMISLMLDVAMGASEKNLFIFHRTSFLLHIANSICILFILFLIFKNIWSAFIPALVFAIHPMTVETICWIGERKTTLSAFFGLLAILLYIIHKEKNSKFIKYLSVFMYMIGLMAKPTIVLLPLGLVILDFWPRKTFQLSNWKKNLLDKWQYFSIMIISSIITYISQKNMSGVANPEEQGGIIKVLIKICYNIILYPIHMIYPVRLSTHLPIPEPLDFRNAEVIWITVSAVLITILVVLSLLRFRAIFASFAYFMVIIFPASGIIGFNDVIISDKYAYFPAVGYLMLFGYIIYLLSGKLSKRNLKMGVICGVLFATLSMVYFGAHTIDYLKYWKDTETHNKYMLTIAPKSAPVHFNLALEYARQKRMQESIEHYELAAKYRPDSNMTWNNLGISYYETKRYADSERAFKKVLEVYPKDPLAPSNLGKLYYALKDYPNAIMSLQKAIENDNRNWTAYHYIGKIYAELGNLDQAMLNMQKANKIFPGNADVYFDMANLFKRNGMTNEAKTLLFNIKRAYPQYEGIDNALKELGIKQ